LIDASSTASTSPRHWPLILASAAVGVAVGGFATTVITHLWLKTNWTIRAYEPVAAFFGVFSLWTFIGRRNRITGLVGVAAALGAMLLGDLFRVLMCKWGSVPFFPPGPLVWPVAEKALRYAFGLYIGWYLTGRWHREPTRRVRSDGTS
jgi:hypothetical protein